MGFRAKIFLCLGLMSIFFLLPQIDFSARDFSFSGCRAENEATKKYVKNIDFFRVFLVRVKNIWIYECGEASGKVFRRILAQLNFGFLCED